MCNKLKWLLAAVPIGHIDLREENLKLVFKLKKLLAIQIEKKISIP